MKNGFVKVRACAPEIRVADCEYNAKSIIECMKAAECDSVELLTLPELCVTGATCGDLFLQKTLIDGAYNAIAEILKASRKMSLVTVFGVPFSNGGKLYNCAFAVSRGRVLGIVPKSNVKNYGEHSESRYFAAAPMEVSQVDIFDDSCPFGVNVLFTACGCEGFTFAIEMFDDLLSPVQPSSLAAGASAQIILAMGADNEAVCKAKRRRELINAQSARLNCGYIFANAGYGESSSDMVFSGHSIVSERGHTLSENKLFSMQSATSEIDLDRLNYERIRKTGFSIDADGYTRAYFEMSDKDFELARKIEKLPFVPENKAERAVRCESILEIQAQGLARRMSHTGAKRAVIGISGGLDSTLAIIAAVYAFDLLGKSRKDILAVTMPCFGTTARTRSNAEILCDELGVSFKCVDISESVRRHFKDIGHDEKKLDTTFENSQARERTQVLMDIANAEGGLVIGTGDLSELVLGWATYNGDHMSMYGVNASIPKTLIRHIAEHFAATCGNTTLEKVVRDILATPVSPELLPASEDEITQKTEDLVGPYELHDFFLYYMLRFGFTPTKIYLLACVAFRDEYDSATILKWLKTFVRRFFAQQFKRSCLPDGAKVGTISVSPRGDLRMPSDASATLWLGELDKLS